MFAQPFVDFGDIGLMIKSVGKKFRHSLLIVFSFEKKKKTMREGKTRIPICLVINFEKYFLLSKNKKNKKNRTTL